MGRIEQFKLQRDRFQGTKELWPLLMDNISDDYVIPIISNSIFNDQLFDLDQLKEMDADRVPDNKLGDENPLGWSIEDQQAIAWANSDEVSYPLLEQHWLPRVALYDRVVWSANNKDSKKRYFNWLKCRLLDQALREDDQDKDVVQNLMLNYKGISFADLAADLNYPRAMINSVDALEILAKLPLSYYITTSPFDFLERALINAGRKPRTQLCFWKEARNVNKEHQTDSEFEPTVDEPLVYHVFGLEIYPDTVVLNEDDYLDFLKVISKDDDQKKPLVPFGLRKAITQSSLILLGYRLRDWEFRVMFRGLIKPEERQLNEFQLAIQMDPSKHCKGVSVDKVRDYLNGYFGAAKFRVEWSTPQEFACRLWEEWERWRR